MADRAQFRVARWVSRLAGLFLASGLGLSQAVAQAPGADVCGRCHEDMVASYQASIHGKKGHPKAPANAGECVACHANGAEHVKAGGGRGAGGIVNPSPRNKAMTAEAKSAVCLTCHSDNR